MRAPAEVWAATCEDPRWIDDQGAMVAQIMREAFEAGMQAGAELATAAFEAHARDLGANLAVRLPPSVAAGILARADVVRDTVAGVAVIDGAWLDAVRQPRPRLRRLG